MEKALPRPLRPHGKGGEQSVRSPPATVGHICGQLSPLRSLQRGLPLHSVAPSLSSFSLSLARSNPPKIGHENNSKRCTFSSLITSSSFPRLFIRMGLTHEKGSPLSRNEGEGFSHISRAVHRYPSLWPE